MSSNHSRRFADHLRNGHHLPQIDAANSLEVARSHNTISDGPVKLWEAANLSASDFADEAARFFDLPRIALPDLLAGQSLATHFSRRFLRETMVFPFQSADGKASLAVAGPGESAASQAAELVLGGEVAIVVASFEDIATALNQSVGDEDVQSLDGGEDLLPREDDIESLRDLASGAPVVRAVTDLLELAVELRASDIHFEAFRTGLSIRMRVDGLLRPVPASVGVLP